MISKQNIFSFRFVSTKWFTFTYRASQQMALDVTFTMENKLVLPFSYSLLETLWNILIFRRGNPKWTWNQVWKNVLFGEDQKTPVAWKVRVLMDVPFQFAFNMQWIVSSKSILLFDRCNWHQNLTTTQQLNQNIEINVWLHWSLFFGQFDPYIGVNVLMRQDNSHFRGGEWTLWLALSSPLRDNSSVAETKDVVKQL